MLEVGPPGDEGDGHVGDRAAGQHPLVLLFQQVGEDQPLPVAVEVVLADRRFEGEAAPPLRRFQQQVHLGVMPQRLEVPDPFDRGLDRLLVDDTPLRKADREPKPVFGQPFQHLQLHRPHRLQCNLLQSAVPADVQLRVLLRQLRELLHRRKRGFPLRQDHLVPQHRLQFRCLPLRLEPEPFPGAGVGEAGHRDDAPGGGAVEKGIFCPRIEPQLVGLLLPGTVRPLPFDRRLDRQRPAGDLHVGEPDAPFPAHLKDPRAEPFGVFRPRHQPGEQLQKLRDANEF